MAKHPHHDAWMGLASSIGGAVGIGGGGSRASAARNPNYDNPITKDANATPTAGLKKVGPPRPSPAAVIGDGLPAGWSAHVDDVSAHHS